MKFCGSVPHSTLNMSVLENLAVSDAFPFNKYSVENFIGDFLSFDSIRVNVNR